MELTYIKPQEIEDRSMEIIRVELEQLRKERGLSSIEETWTPEEFAVVSRCIHTSADFDYGDNLYFSQGAVEAGIRALKAGASIVTDTQMAYSGIRKAALEVLGGNACCFMAQEDVAKEAKERGCTRAVVCMERAARVKGPLILAIGNAPTALIRLRELMDQGEIRPALVIAVPVGFVNVVESKELIRESSVPCIVARGRKGGSNVAAAICNALLKNC